MQTELVIFWHVFERAQKTTQHTDKDKWCPGCILTGYDLIPVT